MLEVYPGGRDQEIEDDVWIADASAAGWIALTKDVSIVRDHTAAPSRGRRSACSR